MLHIPMGTDHERVSLCSKFGLLGYHQQHEGYGMLYQMLFRMITECH